MTISHQQIAASKKLSDHSREISELKRKFLGYFIKLPIQKLAAEFIGKSEDTICDWKNSDPDFASQIASAKSVWALENVSKVKSTEWLLERIMSDHFGQKNESNVNINPALEAALDRIKAILPP